MQHIVEDDGSVILHYGSGELSVLIKLVEAIILSFEKREYDVKDYYALLCDLRDGASIHNVLHGTTRRCAVLRLPARPRAK